MSRHKHLGKIRANSWLVSNFKELRGNLHTGMPKSVKHPDTRRGAHAFPPDKSFL